MSFIYLAGPYSHPDPLVQNARYVLHRRATAHMLLKRMWCYAPIVHCHPLAMAHDLPTDHEFWCEYNQAMLREACDLWVLKLWGWEDSVGVATEIRFADTIGLSPHFVDPQDFGITNPEFPVE